MTINAPAFCLIKFHVVYLPHIIFLCTRYFGVSVLFGLLYLIVYVEDFR